MTPQHSVWPTKAPLVPCHYWAQADWNRHADGFRPADYTGGRFDQAAWDVFAAARSKAFVDRFYQQAGVAR